MPRDISTVIDNLTPQQIAKLAQKLGVARPGGFLQPPIAQGAGLATALLAGLVETQYTEAMPVALNARSLTRFFWSVDQVVGVSAAIYSPVAMPAVVSGETWLFLGFAEVFGAAGDLAGMSMGPAAGASVAFSFGFSLAPSTAATSSPLMSIPQILPARSTQLAFDKSAGSEILSWAVAQYNGSGNQQMAFQNLSATNPLTIKAGSGFVAVRLG